MTDEELIQKAAALIRPKRVKGGLCGDVGAAALSASGKLFTGVCAATGSNVFCAEAAALGAMITAGEYRLAKVVAVWKDDDGKVFVIPPCGNCRQLMRELDEANLEAQVILDKDKAIPLKELLPYHDWWKKQE